MHHYSLILSLVLGYFFLSSATISKAQTYKITAMDAEANDHFGWSVAVDNDTVVVGSYLDDGAAGGGSGSAYVYLYDAQTDSYAQVAKLTASDAKGSDSFGISVAIHSDTIVIGAYLNDGHGSAYVFEKPVSGWVDMNETAKLTASDAATSDSFGYSVAVDSDTVVVGSYGDDAVSGSAYVFNKPVSGWSNMQESAKLTAFDASVGDEFGKTVAVSNDTIVVGAYRDDDGGSNTGSAYVFEKPSSGWIETAKLTASDASMGDLFGSSVAINGDTIVVGAQNGGYNLSNTGSAYVFEKPVSGWQTMNESAELFASDGADGDHFGQSVTISGDLIAVGAYADDFSGTYTGSAYVFEKPFGGWGGNINEISKLIAPDAAENDYFGYCVSISGFTVVIGAYQDDDGGSNSGSAYIYKIHREQKDDVIFDFGYVDALWSYNNDATWTKLHKLTSEIVATGDLDGSGQDDVIVDFGPPYGVYILENNSTWTMLHSLSPEIIAVGNLDGDRKDDCIFDFGTGVGIWVLYNGTTWTRIHRMSPEIIATGDLDGNGKDECIIDFGPGTGVWIFYNNTTWTKLHNLSPEIISTGDLDGNGRDDCIFDFGKSYGTFVLYNGMNWTKLHDTSPEIIAVGDLDGNGWDDCIFDFGTGVGTWVLYNNFHWSKVHTLSPVRIDTGNVDGI